MCLVWGSYILQAHLYLFHWRMSQRKKCKSRCSHLPKVYISVTLLSSLQGICPEKRCWSRLLVTEEIFFYYSAETMIRVQIFQSGGTSAVLWGVFLNSLKTLFHCSVRVIFCWYWSWGEFFTVCSDNGMVPSENSNKLVRDTEKVCS